MLWLTLTALASSPANIVGGEVSQPDAWPTVAAVYRRGDYSCTGVLIAPDVVLTAGHCGRLLTTARIGITDATDTTVESIGITQVIQYPDYLDTYDLALALLDEPSGAPVSPLLFGCATDALRDGSAVTTIGFGATDRFGTDIDGLLREASIPVVDADCDNPTNGCNPQVLPAGEIIAGGDGVDSCNGDSGGPLFLTVNDVDYVAGIVSRAALPATSSCGDGGIYSRVDSVIAWIETEAEIILEPPDCSDFPVTNTPPSLSIAPAPEPVTQRVELAITIDDAEGNSVRLEVIEAPVNGTATLDGTILIYTPDDDVRGADVLTLRATDDGQPVALSDLDVTLTVDTVDQPDTMDTDGDSDEVGGGCSCATSPTPYGVLWLALPVAWFHRRRSTTVV